MSDDELLARVEGALEGLHVRGRKMFRGIGIFSEDVMFSLIYDGVLYLRSTQEVASSYSAESVQFQHPSRSSKMHYWSVPKSVIDDGSRFVEWAAKAFQLAKSIKKG